MSIKMKKEEWKIKEGEIPVDIFTVEGDEKLLFNHNGAKLIIPKVPNDVVLKEFEGKSLKEALKVYINSLAELCDFENKKGICIIYKDSNEYGIAVTSENCTLNENF